MKFKDWLDTWLDLYVKPVAKVQTYEKYESAARVHIVPSLGEYALDELETDVLQRFVASLTRTYAVNTINGIISVLKKSLKIAVKLGLAQRQYADNIQRPKSREKQVECFSVAEQKKIETEVIKNGKPKSFGVVLCLYTGLRVGELLALKWSDIDLKKGLLSVNKSCHWGRDEKGVYGQIIDSPKTVQSERVIPLPKQLLPYLRKIKAKSDSVFVISYKGKPVQTRSYQRAFELLLKKLNIPAKGFHSLRHTFATRALESGMDVKTLSEILGHKNSTITLNRYCHSLMEHKSEMMNKLGKMFG